MVAFQEAGVVTDPQIIILAELAFLQQELQFCGETDIDTKSSLTQAIQSFEDALRCLKTVENAVGYRYAETTYPSDDKHRIKGLPRDALHSACISHRTRIKNILRVPGMNHIERAVYEQRFLNMTAARNSYIELRKKALNNNLQ